MPKTQRVILISLVLFIIVLTIAINISGRKSTQQNKATTPVLPTNTQGNAAANEQSAVVTLTDNGFNPQTLVVKKGTAIHFINHTSTLATVNSDPHPQHTLYPELNLGVMEPNAQLVVVLKKIGTYTYHNHFNASETGTIVVK